MPTDQAPGAAAVEIGSGTPDSNGQVVLVVSDLSPGDHAISVHYDGDGNFNASDSNTITVTIN